MELFAVGKMDIIAFVHHSYKELVCRGCRAFKPLKPGGTIPATGDLEVVAKPSLMWIIRIRYHAFFLKLEVNIVLVMGTECMSFRIVSYTVYFIPVAERAVFLFKHAQQDNITWIDQVTARRRSVLCNYPPKRNALVIGRYPIRLRR